LSKIIVKQERCKACEYCIVACPKKAITATGNINAKGYSTVTVDSEKCIQCGICYHVCPDCVFEMEG